MFWDFISRRSDILIVGEFFCLTLLSSMSATNLLIITFLQTSDIWKDSSLNDPLRVGPSHSLLSSSSTNFTATQVSDKTSGPQ